MTATVDRLIPRSAARRMPERERLAEAIANHTDACEAVRRVTEARERAPRGWQIEERLQAAESALAAARADEPRRLVNELMGDAAVVASPIPDAERAVAEAEADIGRAREVHKLLDARQQQAEYEQQRSAQAVDAAILNVLRNDPTIPALFARLDRARQELGTLTHILGALPTAAWPAGRHGGALLYDFTRIPDGGAPAPYLAAIDAMRTDPDATLPAIDAAPAPSPEAA